MWRIKIDKDFMDLLMENNSESPIEEKLYFFLSRAGIAGFVQQYWIGRYRVDFAFPREKVVVEADGYKWHYQEGGDIESNTLRDDYLKQRGWKVLHFLGYRIIQETYQCVEEICEVLQNGTVPYEELFAGKGDQ